jgi:tetratricopeptide (TPR) repeat protein
MFGRRTVAFLTAIGVCFLASASSAWAAEPSAPEVRGATNSDDASARERAKSLYEEGLTAYRAGMYSDAIDKLLEADRVMPNAAFSYNIGLVYEAMGDERSALRWLRSYLRQSPEGKGQSAILGKVRKFEAELQARGIQQVSILSNPAGATVKIDGIALVGMTPFTAELTPGSHVASVTLDGYDLVQRPFELRPDRAMDVEVNLVATKAAPTPAPATPGQVAPVARTPLQTTPAAPEPQPVRVKPWTWMTLGLGTALLGSALVFEVKRRNAEDDAEAASQDVFLDRYDRMQAAQTTARVLAGVGGVVFATGIGLLTYDLTRGGARTATVGSCSSGGLCAGLRGQF